MANPKHLQILKQGVEAWNQWRGDLTPDLRKADLTRATLSGTDLGWADLSEATLTGADLRKATLSEAILSEANLNGADLDAANLSRVSLGGQSSVTPTSSPCEA